ncbi:MAG TPA: HAMP domain-containing protein [Anaerolineae bacterium]|nr:HAMP domain-containing protein [Anaerolineae bacterium]
MRKKLILSFFIIVLVTVGLVILISNRQAMKDIQTYMFRGGFTGTEEIVIALEDYYRDNQTLEGVGNILTHPPTGKRFRSVNQNTIPKFPPGGKPIWIRVADADGNLIYDTNGQNTKSQLTKEEISRAIPLEVDKQLIGYLLPEGNIHFTPENEASLLNRFNSAIFLAGLISGVAALIVAFLLADRLVKPIRALTNAAHSLAEGHLDERVQFKGNDEIATLGYTFNQMANSLQRAEERRQGLTADIAHELRTPLAVQRAHIEAIEDGIYDLTLENLAPIEEQNRLLSRIVEDLRVLALADTGELTLEKTNINIVALVKAVINRFQAQVQERHVKLSFINGEKHPSVFVDPQRIEQILHNLISNALRYSPENSEITIQLSTNENQLTISIRDSGPGIPEKAIPHLFERFYKTSKSRSREEGGTGLGLSIARKLAIAHHGNLTAENHPEGGALFTLTLPLSSQEAKK